MRTLKVTVLILACMLEAVYAQFDLLEKLKEKVQEKVEKKIDKTADDATEKAEEEVIKEEKEKTSTSVKSSKPEFQNYSKYDYIPGEKVIFYEDFSQDNIGDFPALWFTNKGGEVVTTNIQSGKWFKMKEGGQYLLEKGLKFPQNFTLDFDVIPAGIDENEPEMDFDFTMLQMQEGDMYPDMYVPGKGGVVLKLATNFHSISGYSQGSYGVSGEYNKTKGLLKKNEVNHISIWVQKTRLRLYMHGEKIFDLPKVFLSDIRLDQIRFYLNDNNSPLVSNIRVAEAAGDMRSKFLTEGKLVTHGILFDVNSDKIKPESYSVLKEIAGVLADNKTVRAKIVGHTDSDGSDASNLDLSKRRAASVVNLLVKEFGIEPSRLESLGKGETEPLSSNTTSEGKADNRRVEFIKM
jgi:outer membrane protein OmpA-like peptidoglycan-associated protein